MPRFDIGTQHKGTTLIRRPGQRGVRSEIPAGTTFPLENAGTLSIVPGESGVVLLQSPDCYAVFTIKQRVEGAGNFEFTQTRSTGPASSELVEIGDNGAEITCKVLGAALFHITEAGLQTTDAVAPEALMSWYPKFAQVMPSGHFTSGLIFAGPSGAGVPDLGADRVALAISSVTFIYPPGIARSCRIFTSQAIASIRVESANGVSLMRNLNPPPMDVELRVPPMSTIRLTAPILGDTDVSICWSTNNG